MTLAERILAELDADEALARAAAEDVGSETWYVEYAECGTDWIDVFPGEPGDESDTQRAAHIAAQDPASTLRRCAAIREVVVFCVASLDGVDRPTATHIEAAAMIGYNEGQAFLAEEILTALAGAYVGRPGWEA